MSSPPAESSHRSRPGRALARGLQPAAGMGPEPGSEEKSQQMPEARKRSRVFRALLLLLAVAAVAALGLAMRQPRPWDLHTRDVRAAATSLRARLSETASRVAERVRAARGAAEKPAPREQAALGPAPVPVLVVADTDTLTAGARKEATQDSATERASTAPVPTAAPDSTTLDSTTLDATAGTADSAAASGRAPVSDSTLAAAADSMALASPQTAPDPAAPAESEAEPAAAVASPTAPQPADTTTRVKPAKKSTAAPRIEISLEKRVLWLLRGRDTVLTADIAIGKGTSFEYEGKVYKFVTPKGHLRILSKIEDPTWIPPDWHYYEKAIDRGLEPVFLKPGDRFELSDGSYMEMRGDTVGRLNLRGQWWEWTPGMEIILDGKIFVPPLSSPQRRIPDALGPYKLGLGNGVFIHGTNPYDEDSIGQAVSHGCIRVTNEQLHEIYAAVKVGTPVYIH